MNQCLDRKRRDRSAREVEWNDDAASTQLPAAGAAEGAVEAPDAVQASPRPLVWTPYLLIQASAP